MIAQYILKANYKVMRYINSINAYIVFINELYSLSCITTIWVKVQNFQNPELSKFKFLNLQDADKN